MAKKTIQKNWCFNPEIINELQIIRAGEMRSETNMVEFLIHSEYQRKTGIAISTGEAPDSRISVVEEEVR